MPVPILLLGGGGHCASCIEVLRSTQVYSPCGILDSPDLLGVEVSGIPVIGSDDDLGEFRKSFDMALVTVGFLKTPDVRKRLFAALVESGFGLPVITASTAYRAESCRVSEGTVLMHQSLVNARASVGRNCIINSKALVEHDAVIGDNCHVSTGALINGNCVIGEDCFIGSGSVIRHGLSIAAGCTIGAGAVVVSDITDPGVYAGNPARKIR
jgi:sugar O-acyltransferase (sialic acid O-acetyltransferase NeuD family)